MAAVTVAPGAELIYDPNDKRTVVFDFDAVNLAASAALASAVLTITALKQNGANPLSFDNGGLLAGNRKFQARLLATTATLGDHYQVSVKGTTNETPSQDKEYSIFVLIQDK